MRTEEPKIGRSGGVIQDSVGQISAPAGTSTSNATPRNARTSALPTAVSVAEMRGEVR